MMEMWRTGDCCAGRFRIKPVSLLGLTSAAGAVVCAATLLGFAGRFWWVCDLFSHFRVQYFVALSLLLLLALLDRRFRASVVLGFAAGINLACIVPCYLPTSGVTRGDANVLRIISVNVNTANQHYDLVQQLIREHDPDVILLMEVNVAWIDALDELHSAYPYRKVEPRDDNFGIALFSKRVFTTCDTVCFGSAGVPSLVGELDVAGQQLTLVGTHPLPPITARYAAFRDGQLEAVADYLASVSGPKILLGDLNTSPWSHSFGRLTSVTKLVDSSRGRGVQPTWPTHWIWLRIPIDHCLVSEGIGVQDKQVGADIGSDHFPLIVECCLVE